MQLIMNLCPYKCAELICKNYQICIFATRVYYQILMPCKYWIL